MIGFFTLMGDECGHKVLAVHCEIGYNRGGLFGLLDALPLGGITQHAVEMDGLYHEF